MNYKDERALTSGLEAMHHLPIPFSNFQLHEEHRHRWKNNKRIVHGFDRKKALRKTLVAKTKIFLRHSRACKKKAML